MNSFKKIVNPAICKGWTKSGKEKDCPGFCEITYKDGKLSIHGVIGPTASGNCAGSAGQCVDEIRKGRPTEEWDEEMLQKFCDIWDEWHLNDMRPYCRHMKKLGWDKDAREEITLYHYKLRPEACAKKKDAEEDAIRHLREGKPFVPTEEQVFYATLKYFLDVYDPINEETAKYYEPYKGLHGETEKKTRGWVRYDEDKRGLIGRPCPECGYKYGTSWIKEDVPDDVLQWLYELPYTKKQPAWV